MKVTFGFFPGAYSQSPRSTPTVERGRLLYPNSTSLKRVTLPFLVRFSSREVFPLLAAPTVISLMRRYGLDLGGREKGVGGGGGH